MMFASMADKGLGELIWFLMMAFGAYRLIRWMEGDGKEQVKNGLVAILRHWLSK